MSLFYFFQHFKKEILNKNTRDVQINNYVLLLSIETFLNHHLSFLYEKLENYKFMGDKIPNLLFERIMK